MRSIAERNKLVEDNIKLVYKVAKDYWRWAKRQGVPEFDDLVQNATIGLIKAAEDYDASRDIKFSTVAYRYITTEILNTSNRGGVIVTPSCLRGEIPKVRKTRKSKEQWKRMMSDAFRAKTCCQLNSGFEQNEYETPRKGLDEGFSLDANLLPAKEREEPYILNEVKQQVMRLGRDLSRILFRRYWDGHGYSRIGEDIGVSRTIIKKREERALNELRLIYSVC